MNETTKLRERNLILSSSCCDTNMYADGPRSLADVKRTGSTNCPYVEKCRAAGGMDENSGWSCVMQNGLQIAQFAIKQGRNVSTEISGDFGKFFETLNPPKGFVFSVDRKEFVIIKDKIEVLKRIAEFAEQIVGTVGIPEQAVGPNFESVVAHALTPEGIDIRGLDELEGRFAHLPGRNRNCDVATGPCACGAWH